MKVDHIVYCVQDFRATARRLKEELGLGAYEGGPHHGWGTGNWIVPLGPSYVELFGIVDPVLASQHPVGRWLQTQLLEGDRLAAWSLTAEDIGKVASRLGTGIIPGSRVLPDGSEYRALMTGVRSMFGDSSLPFFVFAETPKAFPGLRPADHRVEPLGVGWVEVGGDEAQLRAWIGDEGAPLRAVGGRPEVRAVGIATKTGEIVLR